MAVQEQTLYNFELRLMLQVIQTQPLQLTMLEFQVLNHTGLGTARENTSWYNTGIWSSNNGKLFSNKIITLIYQQEQQTDQEIM